MFILLTVCDERRVSPPKEGRRAQRASDLGSQHNLESERKSEVKKRVKKEMNDTPLNVKYYTHAQTHTQYNTS